MVGGIAGRLALVACATVLAVPGAASAATPATGPALSVDVSRDRPASSADIYGVNFAAEVGSASALAKLGITADRWGGNSTTRYDWRTGVHNTGSDWHFEDIPPDAELLPHLQLIDSNQAASRHTVLTVPTVGWVPRANVPTTHPCACGYPTETYPNQQSS
ncbi:MAG: glycoside hydrolase family 44 protein [Chloroflexi bacterium]|nr:glycoside hydrolase family 44 protein [Chloroflexota bacterium]